MVIKKKNEGNWEYCVYLGQDENGKKKYKRKCGFKTRKACVQEASIYIKNKSNNNLIFKNICTLFLEYCKNKNLKQNTLISYTQKLNLILSKCDFTNKNIKTINSNDIYNFFNTHTNLYLNSSKRKYMEVLKFVFNYAKRNKLIYNNIFDDIILPKITISTKNIWDKKDIKKYLPTLKNFKYFDVILLVLETGLRLGEVAGLTWDCVNFNKNIIVINKSYISVKGFSGFSTPKTKSGTREIVLLNNSINMLKKRFKQNRSKYVFPNHKNNNIPINPHTLSSHFKRFLINNGIKPINFHALRHIHATLLLNRDINYKILSKRLGHANVSFTLQTYTHVTPDYEVQLFKKINTLF